MNPLAYRQPRKVSAVRAANGEVRGDLRDARPPSKNRNPRERVEVLDLGGERIYAVRLPS